MACAHCALPRRLFVVGLIVFTLASAAGGVAQTPNQLIFFRVVQGVGGALLTPQTLSMLTIIFPPAKRGAAFGIWGAVAGVATIARPDAGRLQAGLTLAPMSVISMFVAPVAGRLSDRLGGKWILFAGLSLWTVGLSIVLASAHPGSSRWHLLPGLLVAGFGLGMTFAPLQTIAMLHVAPRLAGAASGMITTTRQLGAVIGSAAVGALLQAQLSEKLPRGRRSQRGRAAGAVPRPVRRRVRQRRLTRA